MKNIKIEAILKEANELGEQFGFSSEEYSQFSKKYNNGTWKLIGHIAEVTTVV